MRVVQLTEYERLLETMEMLMIPGFIEDLIQSDKDSKAGRVTPLEKVLGRPINYKNDKSATNHKSQKRSKKA